MRNLLLSVDFQHPSLQKAHDECEKLKVLLSKAHASRKAGNVYRKRSAVERLMTGIHALNLKLKTMTSAQTEDELGYQARLETLESLCARANSLKQSLETLEIDGLGRRTHKAKHAAQKAFKQFSVQINYLCHSAIVLPQGKEIKDELLRSAIDNILLVYTHAKLDKKLTLLENYQEFLDHLKHVVTQLSGLDDVNARLIDDHTRLDRKKHFVTLSRNHQRTKNNTDNIIQLDLNTSEWPRLSPEAESAKSHALKNLQKFKVKLAKAQKNFEKEKLAKGEEERTKIVHIYVGIEYRLSDYLIQLAELKSKLALVIKTHSDSLPGKLSTLFANLLPVDNSLFEALSNHSSTIDKKFQGIHDKIKDNTYINTMKEKYRNRPGKVKIDLDNTFAFNCFWYSLYYRNMLKDLGAKLTQLETLLQTTTTQKANVQLATVLNKTIKVLKLNNALKDDFQSLCAYRMDWMKVEFSKEGRHKPNPLRKSNFAKLMRGDDFNLYNIDEAVQGLRASRLKYASPSTTGPK